MYKEDVKELMSLTFEIMGSKELSEAIAKMAKNIVDELEKQGFLRDEAIRILCNLNKNNK